jgi:hypothetical protein
MTQAAPCGIPTGTRVPSVIWCILFTETRGDSASVGCGNYPHTSVAAPSGKVVRQGRPFPSVVRPFVDSPDKSSAKPRILAACLRLTGTFQGSLFHLRFASGGRHSPTASHLLRTGSRNFLPFQLCAS